MNFFRVSISDKEILRLIQSLHQGDIDRGLKYLYELHYASIAHFVKMNHGTPEDAKDIFQEGIIIFYKKTRPSDFKINCSIKTYLFSICKNIWMDRSRQRVNRERIQQDLKADFKEEVESHVLEKEEVEGTLLHLVTQLGEDCRRLLIKFYYDFKSIKEIMVEMGISSEAVAKNKKSNCMKRLKEMIVNNGSYVEVLK